MFTSSFFHTFCILEKNWPWPDQSLWLWRLLLKGMIIDELICLRYGRDRKNKRFYAFSDMWQSTIQLIISRPPMMPVLFDEDWPSIFCLSFSALLYSIFQSFSKDHMVIIMNWYVLSLLNFFLIFNTVFLHFQDENGFNKSIAHNKVTDMRAHPIYSYYANWSQSLVQGFIPAVLLMYFNTKIYLDIR